MEKIALAEIVHLGIRTDKKCCVEMQQKTMMPNWDTQSERARQKSSSIGRKRRWIAAFAADSERQDKETPISITAKLQITFTDRERKATTIPGIGAVKFLIGPSTQPEITNANKKGHFSENKDTEILRKGNCSTTNSSTYTHKNINNYTHVYTHTQDITYARDGGNLFTDQSASLQRALHRIMNLPVQNCSTEVKP